ncbi:MAG: DUF1476 domain-containing protein [Acetobacteraceae bacterium]|nr:DUF1476 domain-containing protein [Acetobacteraceae bacterium]
MTTSFEDREKGFEAKFAHDQEFRFLALARRDKLFARWAAARLGLDEARTEAFVHDVLAVPDGPGHDPALLRLVAERLAEHGARMPEGELTAELGRCAETAREQLIAAPPAH